MKQITEAIHKFQQECPVIENLVEGYGYTYTDLKGLFDVIKPLLAKYELTPIFTMGGHTVNLTLCHSSGEVVNSHIDLPMGVTLVKMNTFQVMGAGITYLKRYLLVSALGIVTTDQCADAALPDKTKPATPQDTMLEAHTLVKR